MAHPLKYEFEVECPESDSIKVMLGLQKAGFERIRETSNKHRPVRAEYGKLNSCCNMITEQMIPLLLKVSDSGYGRNIEEIYVKGSGELLTWNAKDRKAYHSVVFIDHDEDEYGQPRSPLLGGTLTWKTQMTRYDVEDTTEGVKIVGKRV